MMATAVGMGDQGAQKGRLPKATRLLGPGGLWPLSLEHPGSAVASAATAVAPAALATVAAVVEEVRGLVIRLDPGRGFR